MGIRDVITVSALVFGICSWAVLLGGLASVHGTIADSAKTLEEFNTFAFSWFLVCGFLWSWVVTMVCYLVGIMPAAAKFMTPILSILIAWFGVEIQKVLGWVIKVCNHVCLPVERHLKSFPRSYQSYRMSFLLCFAQTGPVGCPQRMSYTHQIAGSAQHECLETMHAGS